MKEYLITIGRKAGKGRKATINDYHYIVMASYNTTIETIRDFMTPIVGNDFVYFGIGDYNSNRDALNCIVNGYLTIQENK